MGTSMARCMVRSDLRRHIPRLLVTPPARECSFAPRGSQQDRGALSCFISIAGTRRTCVTDRAGSACASRVLRGFCVERMAFPSPFER